VNIIAFGLDKTVLNGQSKTAERIKLFGDYVERYTLIVPSNKKTTVNLSNSVTVYGSGGVNKFFQIIKVYFLVKSFFVKQNAIKYDLITVQDSHYLAFLAGIIASKFSIGFEIQIHGFEKNSGIRRFFLKNNLAKANNVRVVSERLKRELIKEFKINPEKITVVSIYTDISAHKCPERLVENGSKKPFTFLTVSRLVKVKNIDLQIEAFAELKKKYPNICLIIVGDGPEYNLLRKKIKAINKADQSIILAGWQKDVSKFYCEADVFLLSSNYEGWGMVVVEAASHELPIIMTDVGCAGELIQNDNNGIIVPVEGKIELLEAMERLILSKEDRERLGKSALEAISRLPSFGDTMLLYKQGWNKALVFSKK